MKYTSLNYNNYDAKFDLDSFEEVIEIAEPTYYLNEYWLVLGCGSNLLFEE